MQIQNKIHLQISPNSRYLSYVIEKDGVSNIYIASPHKPKEAKLIVKNEVGTVTNYFWSHNNKYILYTIAQNNSQISQLHRIDTDSIGETKVSQLDRNYLKI